MSFTLDFESGANGDPATAGPGNTGFDSLLAGAGTMQISTAHPFTGTRGLLCTANSTNSTLCGVKALTSGTTNVTIDDYRYYTALPSAQVDFIRVLDNASAQAFGASVDASGRLRLGNSSGSTITGSASSTGLFVVNQTMHTKITADTSGNIRVRVYIGSSSTATFDSNTITGQSIGSSFATFRDGAKAGSGTATTTVTIDAVTVTEVASGSANAGPDQADIEPWTTVTLDGSASVGATSYAWTQTAGTSVTLSSSTAQKPTFTAPGTIAGTTLTFSLVVNGTSAADTVSAAVLPVVQRAVVGGVEVPARVLSVA